MKLHVYGALGLSLLLPTAARADFQYQETTQITGGSMLGLMRMAGKFSRQAKDAGAPIVSTVYVQGNRMARVNAQRIEIIDLDKETITTVDLQKHTYTEMTFDQMRQQMQQAVQQAKETQATQNTRSGSTPSPGNMNTQFKVNVRNTGATKQVSGLSTTEAILTMQMVGTNTTNGQQGSLAMTNDMWLAPAIPGYQELQGFNKKLAAKMGDIYTGSGMSALTGMQPAQAQGMASMAKEVSKLKGVPVEQVMRMGATANGQPLPAASEAALPPSSSGPQVPSAKGVAQQSAESVIASKLGGFGFGGFGRKKKQSPPPDNSANAQSQPETQTPNQAQVANVLMESTTNLTGFSSAPIDPAKFSVPAGFTQVEPQSVR